MAKYFENLSILRGSITIYKILIFNFLKIIFKLIFYNYNLI